MSVPLFTTGLQEGRMSHHRASVFQDHVRELRVAHRAGHAYSAHYCRQDGSGSRGGSPASTKRLSNLLHVFLEVTGDNLAYFSPGVPRFARQRAYPAAVTEILDVLRV